MPANRAGTGPGGTVYASEEAHMSISKSVALLGIGRENLHLIPTDTSFQMINEELQRAIAAEQVLLAGVHRKPSHQGVRRRQRDPGGLVGCGRNLLTPLWRGPVRQTLHFCHAHTGTKHTTR